MSSSEVEALCGFMRLIEGSGGGDDEEDKRGFPSHAFGPRHATDTPPWLQAAKEAFFQAYLSLAHEQAVNTGRTLGSMYVLGGWG